ncbi:hypothetical protein F2Q69_00058825 [Brassica cretica]|uniref:Uncharacterized protein n=1 Tax=Brassica cretica TaxID=69181 RepID=A0A8S9REX8_BRACR|nr:hypothetical protein F2Q69_00058825 [Brassica cretica]
MVSSSKRTSWIVRRIQHGRSPRWTSPVRRTAELDRPWDSARPFTELDRQWDSARPFAKLDQYSMANGRDGSSTGFSSAVPRVGPVQFGEWPSWIDHEWPSCTSPFR